MEELPSDVVGLVDKVIVRSSYATLLGMELVDAAEGRVRVKLPYRADLTTYGDTVHGGAISALIDVAATACFWASRSVAAGAQGAGAGAHHGHDGAVLRERQRPRQLLEHRPFVFGQPIQHSPIVTRPVGSRGSSR